MKLSFIDKIKDFQKNHSKWLNLYTILLAAFIIFVAFFDSQSFVKRVKVYFKQKRVNMEIREYQEKIETANERYSDMDHNDTTVERYARETYYMHEPDEKVFIIDEDE